MSRSHRVAILALPSVVPFDLGVPLQIFGYPRPDLGQQRYLTTVCGARAGRVPSCAGMSIVVPAGLDALREVRTIVVPGIDDLDRAIPRSVCDALVEAFERGTRIVSICTGAFVLAAAGLLDGRRATTHWLDCARLQLLHPRVEVDPNVLYVDEGQILTSAGIAAGIDLCLHVVRSDYGPAVANAMARRLVVPAHRGGGQAQFVSRPVDCGGISLKETRDWLLENLPQSVTVQQMAAHAGTSARTFARRFVEETGASPLRWLIRQRLAAAQRLLEETKMPLARVAAETGLGSEVSLRAHFRRELSTTPAEYRRAFAAVAN